MIEDRPPRQPHTHQSVSCEDDTCFGTLLGGKPDLRRIPRNIANTSAFSTHPWDPLTFVQGGARGVVFSADGARRTAFVEAFSRGTFLRGEGTTIEEADDACWAKLQQIEACPAAPDHGPFERRDYLNGVGYCTRCNFRFSGVFEPLEIQGPQKPSFFDRLFGDDDNDQDERLNVLAEVLSAKVDADQETSRRIRDAVGVILKPSEPEKENE